MVNKRTKLSLKLSWLLTIDPTCWTFQIKFIVCHKSLQSAVWPMFDTSCLPPELYLFPSIWNPSTIDLKRIQSRYISNHFNKWVKQCGCFVRLIPPFTCLSFWVGGGPFSGLGCFRMPIALTLPFLYNSQEKQLNNSFLEANSHKGKTNSHCIPVHRKAVPSSGHMPWNAGKEAGAFLPGVCILRCFWVFSTWSFRHACQKLRTLQGRSSPLLSPTLPSSGCASDSLECRKASTNARQTQSFLSPGFSCWRALNNSHPSWLTPARGSTGRLWPPQPWDLPNRSFICSKGWEGRRRVVTREFKKNFFF